MFIKGYLACSTDLSSELAPNVKITAKNRFGISDNAAGTASNIYSGLAFVVYSFVYSDEAEYTNNLATYNTGSAITIGDVKIDPLDINDEVAFDNANKTITLTRRLNIDSLKTQYGEEKFATYSTIKDLYKTIAGYTCTYEIEE